jgi:hypothetical protein
VHAEVEGVVVVGRDVESVWDVMPAVAEVDSLRGRQDGLDAVLWLRGSLLWRVCRFWAASRLPMKSPPAELRGGRMQE